MKSSARIHLLPFEEEPTDEYLLALHTNLEAYQIAFFLNQHCQTQFRRTDDIYLKNRAVSFILFEWENQLLDQTVSLFSNRFISDEVQIKEYRLHYKPCCKYSGIYIDPTMTFRDHIDHVVKN